MANNLLVGLGLGLILYPATDYLHQIPFVGKYTTLILVVIGLILLIKGYTAKK